MEGTTSYIDKVVNAAQGAGLEKVLEGCIALLPILLPIGVGFLAFRKMVSMIYSTITNA